MTRRRLTLVAGQAILAALALLLPASAIAQTTQVVEYYHTDALGSVRALTNQQGQVIRRHDFLPFGEELQPTVPPPDKPLFTGKERDAETGLDYFGARYQRAGVGRFTTVDPLMTFDENLADPQRWNRYTYARTNPLRWVDPDGRQIMRTPVAILERNAQIRDSIESLPIIGVDKVTEFFTKLMVKAVLSTVLPKDVKEWTASSNAAVLAGAGPLAVEGAAIREGATIFRVFGGEARGMGRSWTTVAPDAVNDFRAAAGLFPQNAGGFVAEAKLTTSTGFMVRPGIPGPATPPGTTMVPELYFNNTPVPGVDIRLIRVSGLNPPK